MAPRTSTKAKASSTVHSNGTTLDDGAQSVALDDGTPSKTKGKTPAGKSTALIVRPFKQGVLEAHIRGDAPYMQHRFSQKARLKMMETQREGSQARSKRVREPRDFAADCEAATYRMTDGSYGMPCGAYRNGMISACKVVGFHMSKAKLGIRIIADGYDALEGTPMVRLYGEPEQNERPVRNETGVVDIRSRPLWRDWKAIVRVRFDADLFSHTDVLNLLVRMGAQVGIGEGRADSPRSNGIDYGYFAVVTEEEWERA